MGGEILRGGLVARQGTLHARGAHGLFIPARAAGEAHEGAAALARSKRLDAGMHDTALTGLARIEAARQLHALVKRHAAARAAAADRLRIAANQLAALTALHHGL